MENNARESLRGRDSLLDQILDERALLDHILDALGLDDTLDDETLLDRCRKMRTASATNEALRSRIAELESRTPIVERLDTDRRRLDDHESRIDELERLAGVTAL